MLTALKVNQASKGTRFKLWCATKQDYRTADITQVEAEQILAEANAKNGYQPKTKETTQRLTTAAKASPLSKVAAPKNSKDSILAYIVANIGSFIGFSFIILFFTILICSCVGVVLLDRVVVSLGYF